MPSDPRLSSQSGVEPASPRARALAALERPIASYRSIILGAAERARGLLSTTGGAERARLELGAFGASRLDATRFAELTRGAALDAISRARLTRAAAVLDEIAAASDESLLTVDVPSGESLGDAASRAFARLGRGFGAAAAVELVRTGRYDPARHDRLTEAFPFDSWSRADRSHAPPLVISVDGANLRAAALADLLDGTVRLVILVRGACAPAPLVRLVTPGTFVAQVGDMESLVRVASWDGPAVVAVVADAPDAALFVHDPANGRATWQRLTMVRRPAVEPRRTLGGASPRQQREELLQLEALAEPPALPTTPVEALVASGAIDPAGRLTAWLLAESGLTDGGPADDRGEA